MLYKYIIGRSLEKYFNSNFSLFSDRTILVSTLSRQITLVYYVYDYLKWWPLFYRFVFSKYLKKLVLNKSVEAIIKRFFFQYKTSFNLQFRFNYIFFTTVFIIGKIHCHKNSINNNFTETILFSIHLNMC